jgi:hypothetical protein
MVLATGDQIRLSYATSRQKWQIFNQNYLCVIPWSGKCPYFGPYFWSPLLYDSAAVLWIPLVFSVLLRGAYYFRGNRDD